MNTLYVGQNFIEVPSTPSTNDLAWELLPTHPPEGTVISTPHQSAGKGQAGSAWESQPGQNLTFSLILYPKFLASDRVFELNKIVSLAIWQTLKNLLPQKEISIKWPNDILVEHKKISGILIMNQLGQNSISGSVVGIGLNVNQTQFSPAIQSKTTSIRLENDHSDDEWDLNHIWQPLLGNLEKRYLQLRAGKQEEIAALYVSQLLGYQEMRKFEIGGEVKEGMIMGIDKFGRLALQMEGQIQYFGMKEVAFCL